jgi:hypothetical protein
MKNATLETINALEVKMAAIAAEIAYLKAWDFLEDLSKTATNIVYPLFHSLYGETTKSFCEYDFTPSWSKRSYTKIVKDAISRCKSETQTKTNPWWAKEAIKAAAIVDSYTEA